jgi:hypothetical protein
MHLYTGKFDLTFTVFQIPILGIWSGLFATGAWRHMPWNENKLILSLGILGLVSLGFSLVLAYRANRNLRLALLVFLLKYIYATVMLGLGFIALFISLLTLPYMGKSEYLRDEAKGLFWHFLKSPGIGAALLRCVGRWNRKLIRPVDGVKNRGQTSNINSNGGESAGVVLDQ